MTINQLIELLKAIGKTEAEVVVTVDNFVDDGDGIQYNMGKSVPIIEIVEYGKFICLIPGKDEI